MFTFKTILLQVQNCFKVSLPAWKKSIRASVLQTVTQQNFPSWFVSAEENLKTQFIEFRGEAVNMVLETKGLISRCVIRICSFHQALGTCSTSGNHTMKTRHLRMIVHNLYKTGLINRKMETLQKNIKNNEQGMILPCCVCLFFNNKTNLIQKLVAFPTCFSV